MCVRALDLVTCLPMFYWVLLICGLRHAGGRTLLIDIREHYLLLNNNLYEQITQVVRFRLYEDLLRLIGYQFFQHWYTVVASTARFIFNCFKITELDKNFKIISSYFIFQARSTSTWCANLIKISLVVTEVFADRPRDA